MPTQSVPHGTASLHAGSGSTAIATATVPSSARMDHGGLAQFAGLCLAQTAASAHSQAWASSGTESDDIGTGVSVTRGLCGRPWRRSRLEQREHGGILRRARIDSCVISPEIPMRTEAPRGDALLASFHMTNFPIEQPPPAAPAFSRNDCGDQVR
jgi:hypothetical protein